MRNRCLIVLLAFLIPLFPRAALTQYQVLNGAFTNGGGVRAGGGYICYDTAGQPVIGVVSGASNIAKSGFWYCAGISSTVDVDFASFFGELKDDAVLLSWSSSASAPFEGFNVYRAESSEGAFAKLNAELLPKERGGVYTDRTALAGITYVYRVGAVSKEGEWYSQNVSLTIPPKPTTLYQNYPNPSNPSTNVGIGITTLGAKIHVNGDALIGSSAPADIWASIVPEFRPSWRP